MPLSQSPASVSNSHSKPDSSSSQSSAETQAIPTIAKSSTVLPAFSSTIQQDGSTKNLVDLSRSTSKEHINQSKPPLLKKKVQELSIKESKTKISNKGSVMPPIKKRRVRTGWYGQSLHFFFLNFSNQLSFY